MIKNLKENEKIVKLPDGTQTFIKIDAEGIEQQYILSDTCPCGKPTDFNRFWTSDHQHQLCDKCSIFSIRGTLEDMGFTITK